MWGAGHAVAICVGADGHEALGDDKPSLRCCADTSCDPVEEPPPPATGINMCSGGKTAPFCRCVSTAFVVTTLALCVPLPSWLRQCLSLRSSGQLELLTACTDNCDGCMHEMEVYVAALSEEVGSCITEIGTQAAVEIMQDCSFNVDQVQTF